MLNGYLFYVSYVTNGVSKNVETVKDLGRSSFYNEVLDFTSSAFFWFYRLLSEYLIWKWIVNWKDYEKSLGMPNIVLL